MKRVEIEYNIELFFKSAFIQKLDMDKVEEYVNLIFMRSWEELKQAYPVRITDTYGYCKYLYTLLENTEYNHHKVVYKYFILKECQVFLRGKVEMLGTSDDNKSILEVVTGVLTSKQYDIIDYENMLSYIKGVSVLERCTDREVI